MHRPRRPRSTSAIRLSWLALLGLCAGCAATVAGDPSGARDRGAGPQSPEDAAAIPIGPQHEAMQPLVGEWTLELVSFANDPGGEVIGRGTGTIRAELGGRYLVWSTAVEAGSGEHHGAGLLGYDMGAKQYEFLWVSGRTTGMPIARGEGVLMGRGIDLNIQVRDPRTGRLVGGRTLLRATDRDHFVVENYGLDVVGELRVRQRTKYTRVQR